MKKITREYCQDRQRTLDFHSTKRYFYFCFSAYIGAVENARTMSETNYSILYAERIAIWKRELKKHADKLRMEML